MFDIRYHWLSLMALFVSLGLGVLIGTSLGQGDFLSEEQRRLTSQLEASLTRLREENRALNQARQNLTDEVERQQRAIELLARTAMKDRLKGRTYVLVYPHDVVKQDAEGRATGAERWRNVLARAGAVATEVSLGELLMEGERMPAGAQPIFMNPPPNVPIPDGARASVIWDTSPREGQTVLPSEWYKVRAGEGPLAEWVFVEGLRQGWQGHIDAIPESNRFLVSLEKMTGGLTSP